MESMTHPLVPFRAPPALRFTNCTCIQSAL